MPIQTAFRVRLPNRPDELARVEGGLVCIGTLYIGWADGGHVVIPLWA